ncbi:MAG: DUF819 family protein, partial [Flavobacteriaceae bacterium]|nr:DUF819 family protein [Flavobacteriaceae bacterium]
EYNFQENGLLYAGTVAVDNVVTTIWIIFTLAIPSVFGAIWKGKRKTVGDEQIIQTEEENLTLHSLMWLIFIGVGAYFIAEAVSELIPSIPSILTLSTIGILLAQFKFISNLNGSHFIGLYLVYLFLAVIGAYCEISSVVELQDVGLTLLAFTSIAVLIHGIIIISLGSLFYRDWDMIAITSQANIGGGTTAIALAETFNRKELILPAILVGTLGNALGTYLGFLIVYIL